MFVVFEVNIAGVLSEVVADYSDDLANGIVVFWTVVLLIWKKIVMHEIALKN